MQYEFATLDRPRGSAHYYVNLWLDQDLKVMGRVATEISQELARAKSGKSEMLTQSEHSFMLLGGILSEYYDFSSAVYQHKFGQVRKGLVAKEVQKFRRTIINYINGYLNGVRNERRQQASATEIIDRSGDIATSDED